eukprot:1126571-Pyramimonas_sp.AAC.1
MCPARARRMLGSPLRGRTFIGVVDMVKKCPARKRQTHVGCPTSAHVFSHVQNPAGYSGPLAWGPWSHEKNMLRVRAPGACWVTSPH